MPVLKLYEHGTTAGVAPRNNNHERSKRGKVCGWSQRSIRANTQFLYSVRSSGLTGHGMALTLTLRDCPPSHSEWARMVDTFIKRMRRLGMVRLHWLTEWQRRRVPHLHCALWFSDDDKWLRERVLDAWLMIAAPYAPRRGSQTAEPIYDAIGWFKYTAKHASRGLAHYQRTGAAIPPGWETTGRMWGYSGSWSLAESQQFDCPQNTYHAFRRIIRGWRKANARAEGNGRRIAQARRMLSCNDQAWSAVRGISEWLDVEATMAALLHLGAQGYRLEQR